jgi:hypothetical protein
MANSLSLIGSRFGRLAAVACVILAATISLAAPLGTGQTLYPAPGEPDPTGGVAACGSPVTYAFATGTFSGTLTTTVIAGDPSNPYGGLTFTYVLHNDATSTNVNARLTTRDWTGFSTDASYQTPATGVIPTYIDRLTVDVIGFSFQGPPIGAGPIPPGANSAVLVVQSNAHTCVDAIANVIDGSTANVQTLGPAPEPSALVLLAMGGFALIRRRR